jgi:riboflavin biosynthesis pyrimidine reductase
MRGSGYDELSLLVLPQGPYIDPNICFQRLFGIGIGGILVEGGSETIARIIASGSFDLFTVFYGPMMMGGLGPTIAGGPGFTGGPIPLKLISLQRPKGGGLLVEYEPVG